MQLQFNCPHCGVAMQASIQGAGANVECPSCGQQFKVESETPVVKAQAVPVSQGRPVQRQVPQGRAAQPAPVRKKAGASESQKLFAGLGVAAVLLVGVVVWIQVEGRKRVEPPPPRVAEEVSALSKSVPAPKPVEPEETDPAKVRMNEELEKIKEALVASEKREKQRIEEAANRSGAARDAVLSERQAEHEALRDHLAENVFGGDTAVAEEFLSVQNDVMWGASNRMNDGDSSNDFKNREDFEAFVMERLLVWFEKKPLLSEWLKTSQRDPRKVIQEILQTRPQKSSKPEKSFDFSKYASVGSGFWISSDGWLVSNDHVVSDSKTVELRLRDGTVVPAQVVKTDEESDLALIKADHAPKSWLAVSKGEKDLQLGRTVFTVGYPNPMIQGVEAKFTDGRVSAASGFEDSKDSYQITVPIQQGNSGGALVDFETGWVVGVINAKLLNRAGASADNVSYAIKGKLLSGLIESVSEAKTAVAKVPAKPITKGSESEVISRATEASVLILRPKK
ncbi:trypsin-like peptidase domain-containing protein [Luteolibacter sp. GHJ8]|uniref:Trypsin-like peptidase domain-containing protein n=1 Tax=Luteolibacter rhizosphaerae TaxID=2989719 RepID=A0ABT3FZA9_9BACT|nr:trypsin-like peptidase domain-containing protein [Luteolibacter rhizosphaerae]MCW1912305.1 trypsin-like peptidase domain-containing protein [Luteolibacter rhizosphaerae]